MNYESAQIHLTKYIEANYAELNKKQAYNLKFRIKSGWNNESCKVALKFKDYIKNDELIISTEENLKISKMNILEIKEYEIGLEKVRIYNICKSVKTNKSKFNKSMKLKNIKGNIFDNCNYKPIVELVSLEDKNDPEYQDGRITKTIELMRIQNELFDDAVKNMTDELNRKLVLDFTLEEWRPILNEYYNKIRLQHENKINLLNMNDREKQLEMMVDRKDCLSHKEWICKMKEQGFYCGYPCHDYLGPVSDPDAWIFVGTKWTDEIDKFRDRIDREYMKDGYSPRNVKESRATFVECLFNIDKPEEFKKTPKICMTGYNSMNINPTNVSYIKKRFQHHYIDRKLHTNLNMYGKSK